MNTCKGWRGRCQPWRLAAEEEMDMERELCEVRKQKTQEFFGCTCWRNGSEQVKVKLMLMLLLLNN